MPFMYLVCGFDFSVRFSMSCMNTDGFGASKVYMSHFIFCSTYLGLLVCRCVSYSVHVKISTLRCRDMLCLYVHIHMYSILNVE
jgi:hypothetical protein